MKAQEQQTDAAVAFIAGQESARAVTFHEQHGLPMVVVPTGDGGFNVVEKPDWLPHPRRVVTTVQLRTPQSFVDYVNRFGTAQTVVFAKSPVRTEIGSFTAIIDYHTAANGSEATARNLKHQAVFKPELTVPWTEWLSNNDKPMDQVAFSQFLEDHIPDIALPSAADLVEVARYFEAHKSVAFKSAFRPKSTTIELQYEETVREIPQAGKMELPSEITLAFPIFDGAEVLPIRARVRYAILAEGRLQLRYILVRPEEVLREVFLRTADAITKSLSADRHGLVVNGSVG